MGYRPSWLFYFTIMTVRTGSKFGETLPFTLANTITMGGNRIFIRRFPIEPLTAEFEPSAYNINSSGAYPRYRAKVFNRFQGYDNGDYDTPVTDLYIVSGSCDSDSIELNRNDGETIEIDLSPIVGWYQGD